MSIDRQVEQAHHWIAVLRDYRGASTLRSIFEVALSFSLFFGAWSWAVYTLSMQQLLPTMGLAVFIGFMLMRLFCLMHDCGHNALFKQKWANLWVGRATGFLCLTPMSVWTAKHELHHRNHGSLDDRGMGDIHVMTVTEYRNATALKRLAYRIYRNPLFLLIFGPFAIFLMEYRLPSGLIHDRKYWTSAISTNIGLAFVLGSLTYFHGVGAILFIFLPSVFVGGFAGVWVFYVQHQFEGMQWKGRDMWNPTESALFGSSYLVLPRWLNWFTCNIAIHHVHHTYARIPFYHLPCVLEDHPELAEINRLTIKDCFHCMRLKLWDENMGKLVGFP